jgi:hypothetical protein
VTDVRGAIFGLRRDDGPPMVALVDDHLLTFVPGLERAWTSRLDAGVRAGDAVWVGRMATVPRRELIARVGGWIVPLAIITRATLVERISASDLTLEIGGLEEHWSAKSVDNRHDEVEALLASVLGGRLTTRAPGRALRLVHAIRRVTDPAPR